MIVDQLEREARDQLPTERELAEQIGVGRRAVHRALDVLEAIDQPLLHTTHVPTSSYPCQRQPGHIMVEESFAKPVLDALRVRGHALGVAPGWSIGRLTAARRDPDGCYARPQRRG